MEIDYGLLINLVEGFPHLYNKADRNFKNARMRENSWLEISKVLQTTPDNCQRIWRNLRDRYTKEKRVLHSGDEGAGDTAWEFYRAMTFLDKHIKPRKTYSATSVPAPLTSPSTSSSCSSQSPWSALSQILSPPAPDTEFENTEENIEEIIITQEPHPPIEEIITTQEPHPHIEEIIATQESESPNLLKPRNSGQYGTTPQRREKIHKITSNANVGALVGAAHNIASALEKRTVINNTETTDDAFGKYVVLRLKEMQDKRRKKLIKNKMWELLVDSDSE